MTIFAHQSYLEKYRIHPRITDSVPSQALKQVIIFFGDIQSSPDAIEDLLGGQPLPYAVEFLIPFGAIHLPFKLPSYAAVHPLNLAPTMPFSQLFNICMDEATDRLMQADQRKGQLIPLVSGSEFSPDFLGYIHEFFRRKSGTQALEIPFAYPQTFPSITYETHLRNLVQRLRDMDYPHAFYSELGSFAIRCDAYQAQNGISKQAQDPAFDLMYKFAKIGRIKTFDFANVKLPWRSDMNLGKWQITHTRALHELEKLFAQVEELFEGKTYQAQEATTTFLQAEHFEEALEEMRKHGKSFATFQQRFFAWWHPNRIRKLLK